MGITDRQLSALFWGAGLGLAHFPVLNDHSLIQKRLEAFRQGGPNPPPPKDANIFDMTFIYDPELSSVAQAHAADHQLFVDDFVDAWTLLMNADRFEISCSDLENTVMIDVATMGAEMLI